jgi:DNA polymerase III gamma/tau subunit
MSFWDKTVNSQQVTVTPEMVRDSNTIVLDEQVMAELQEDPNIDIFEEEEEDTSEIMADANLRLEMGRLYQMIMRHDLFGDTDADPKAIKIVQREIRKLVREKMEVMLGIRQEQAPQVAIVSSPFNDMEVTVLKMLASKMTKGATEESEQPAPPIPVAPKKDGITAINGSLRPNPTPTPLPSKGVPLRKASYPAQKAQPVKKPAQSAISKSEEPSLQKPIEEMTQEELAAHDAAALERRSKNYAKLPTNMVPHPTGPALEMMYVQQASNMSAPGGAVANIMALMNQK